MREGEPINGQGELWTKQDLGLEEPSGRQQFTEAALGIREARLEERRAKYPGIHDDVLASASDAALEAIVELRESREREERMNQAIRSMDRPDMVEN